MFDKNLCFLQVEGLTDRESALNIISDKMVESGYVDASYGQALIEREEDFPTAMMMEAFGVALPHAESSLVIDPHISVMTLAQPIEFYQIDEKPSQAPVSMIIVLALKDADDHLSMLQNLMKFFHDSRTLAQVMALQNTEEDIDKLKGILEKFGII